MLPRWLGVAARGGVRAGVRASAGSGVAPGGRATTGGHSGQQVRQGARLRVDSTNSRNCLLIALLLAGEFTVATLYQPTLHHSEAYRHASVQGWVPIESTAGEERMRGLVALFNDRLNQLFATVHPRGRGPHTLQEVADAVNATGIAKISPSYLSQLRNGQKDNPSSRTIEALARFFKVDPAFFFDSDYARAIEADLAVLARLRDAGVRNIAARSFDLSPENLRALEAMTEALRASQGLPPGHSGLPQGGEGQAGDS